MYASLRFSEKNQSPGHTCERICFSKGVVQVSEIKDGSQATILFGRGSIGCRSPTHSEPGKPFLWLLLPAKIHHIVAQDVCVLTLNRGGDHAAKSRGSSSELEYVTSFYYPKNPV